MSRSPSLLLFVFLGLTLSLSILLLSSPHDITPSPSLRKNVEKRYQTNPKSENILKCETLKIKYNIVDVLQEIREYEPRREWARLRCTSFFWSRDYGGNLLTDNVKVIKEEIITETKNSFSASAETDVDNIIVEKTKKNVDPMFGRHWPETPTPDIIHTLHGTSKPSSSGLPSSKTSVWDLVHSGHLKVSNGVCPTSPAKCCPKKDPKNVWGNSRNPLLAICTGVTSRGVGESDRHPGHLALFQKLMPSIVKTYDCDIDYLVVVGFDEGDPFYDSVEGQEEVREWFVNNMARPMAESGVEVKFVMVEVVNKQQKPGPVFNAMLREAYEAGADYYYRLNDDSELQLGDTSPPVSWPKVFIGVLHSFGPPYGVVGPNGGLPRILTHDFVHRTHMEIFNGAYYPTPLVDWYMDDWVSHVYGKSRTIKATKFNVEHHTTHHGQRYKVDRSNEKKLRPLITQGRQMIANYAEKEGMVKASVIINDPMPPPFMDLPCGDWTGLKC
ncbi:hypothetical protein TrVE_jg11684 [Triparma verrucosa]|uniref:Uncharacterized protein n=1 Tax=Triparma verrucosa TaxID=1606542 RepID=A0A9W7BP39_9STRA|nr:hypothetical protein TrVE_jg11684 [Triparma verrucosa]